MLKLNDFKPNFVLESDMFGWVSLNESILDEFNSLIVNREQLSELMKLCKFDQYDSFKLLYRATKHGFGSDVFHSKCDGHGDTMTIIKPVGSPNVFGVYVSTKWGSNSFYKADTKAFLFSLINNDNKSCKLKIAEPLKAIYCHKQAGPTFGASSLIPDNSIANKADILIFSNSNKSNNFACLTSSSKHSLYVSGTIEVDLFLAESSSFKTN